MKIELISDVDSLSPQFKAIIALGAGSEIDWSVGQIFTKALGSAPTFTFTNLHVGVKFIKTTGDYSPIFPAGFTYVGGTRSVAGTTWYQIVCDDAATPTGIYSILKET